MKLTIIVFISLVCAAMPGYSIVSERASDDLSDPVKYFNSAQPIWPTGRRLEKNLTIGFRGKFEISEIQNTSLKITGSSLYRIFLNGKFIGHGPARAAHDYYRVDELDLTDNLETGTNILAIEVAGYNVNSYYLIDQPSFLQAEVVSGEHVLLSTKSNLNGFQAMQITERIQKVPRYSFQRPFIECYNLSPGSYNWRSDLSCPFKELPCEIASPKQLIPRRVKYSDFEVLKPDWILSHGQVKTGLKKSSYWKDSRALLNIGEKLGGFTEKELEMNPSIDLQEMRNLNMIKDSIQYFNTSRLSFPEDTYRILGFEHNTTGFIGAQITCKKPGRLYITFDEILSKDDVDFKRMLCINTITYNLTPGTYSIESFEPYTFKYLKIIMTEGECEIENIYLREYVNSDITNADFKCSDKRLNSIYDAGVETFKQNVVDLFMDCPSRERGPWLGDSYFISRVAPDLSGNTLVEKNFFENFLLPERFAHIPDGMLPMCYPCDHYDSDFIPNWAMWFVVQLEEYFLRSNDRDMVDALKPKVMKLFNYFDTFLNEEGLLEKLDGSIFIEWSMANRFTQDVNYPTNMLYSAALEAAANLYNLPYLNEKAEKIREVIRLQSFNGRFFVDNATRNENGDLEITTNVTEVCQYFAFFFNIATPETHFELWNNLEENFGPERKTNNQLPDGHFANSFPGIYLRLELLSRYKKTSKLLDESVGFFYYMAERTGTLWENVSPTLSLNHGFASHAVHLLYRDVLGIFSIDIIEKKITLQFSDLGISSCMGKIPIGDEVVMLEWQREGNTILYHTNIPEDYKIDIINLSGLKLVQK